MGLRCALLVVCLSSAAAIFPQGPKPPLKIPAVNPSAPTKLSEKKSVLVLGGGVAGLSAALELAERGYDVTVKEAQERLGGRLYTHTRVIPGVGTFEVDLGFHAWFHNYFQFKDIRARLGIDKNFMTWPIANYIFRTYKPEAIYSSGPYPLNMLGVIVRSPNLHFTDAMKLGAGEDDMNNFNYTDIYQKWDHLTFEEWAAQQMPKGGKMFDITMRPVEQTTVNLREKLSAAYMLSIQQMYFLDSPKADEKTVTTKPWSVSVIGPWEAHLKSIGVQIETNTSVQSLHFANGTLATVDGEAYDHVVMAAHQKSVQGLLASATTADPATHASLEAIRTPVSQLPNAPPFKILRAWFDGPLGQGDGVNKTRPMVVEVPEHFPICLIAQYHLMEDESKDWAAKTGGSVIEFHLYTYNATDLHAPDAEVWAAVRPTVLDIYPEIESLKVLGLTIGTYDNMPGWHAKTFNIRPHSTTPSKQGIKNLAFAGDWLHTEYPSAFMERAVSTGREAANAILLSDGVRQVDMVVPPLLGPGAV